MYQHRDVEEIEKQLYKYVCYWFVDNKLSIQFREMKSNLFFLRVSLKLKVQDN